MQREDLPALEQLQRGVMANPWRMGQFGDSLEAGDLCLVVLDASEIVACAVARTVADEAELLTIATRATRQRAGIARLLLEEILEQCGRAGARQCFLEVMVGNSAALGLYQYLGFKQVGVRPAYYPSTAGPVDALVLKLQLESRN